MKPFARIALGLAGLLTFSLVWVGVVEVTRPAPRVRATLGFSAPKDGTCTAVVVNHLRETKVKGTISLAAADRIESLASLRTILGEDQPIFAVIDPASQQSSLTELLEAAKNEFGGGLLVFAVEKEAALRWRSKERLNGDLPDGAVEADARARMVQAKKATNETWLALPHEALAALVEMSPAPNWSFLWDAVKSLPDLDAAGRCFSKFIFSCEMLGHALASLYRVFTGFLLATLLGVPFGLALGRFAELHSLTNATIQILRPISPIAWLPTATLLFGGGNKAAVFLIFLASSFPIIISTAAAVGTIDLKYRRSALNFNCHGFDLARSVLLPATMPSILTALRVTIGVAWLVVVAAEMLGVEAGLGYLVLDARNQLRWDRVAAAMIMIGAIGLMIDTVMRRIERVVLERRGLLPR